MSINLINVRHQHVHRLVEARNIISKSSKLVIESVDKLLNEESEHYLFWKITFVDESTENTTPDLRRNSSLPDIGDPLERKTSEKFKGFILSDKVAKLITKAKFQV